VKAMSAEVKVGDPVIVTQWRCDPIEARVSKAARVWLEITESDNSKQYPTTWRMRRDTQQENVTSTTVGGGTYQARFYTPGQWAQKQRTTEANDLLTALGIQLSWDQWTDERRIKLADVLHAARERGEL
jgi:hypothetical protein